MSQDMGLENAGLHPRSDNGKLETNDHDQTAVDNIFAIGDIAHGKPELTPPAVKAGIKFELFYNKWNQSIGAIILLHKFTLSWFNSCFL